MMHENGLEGTFAKRDHGGGGRYVPTTSFSRGVEGRDIGRQRLQ